MKNKYERMSKEEKKEVYKEYKLNKKEFSSKMEKMFILCYVGIGYAILMFIYDFFYKKSTVSYILDIVVFVFSIIALLKVVSIKKDLLNKFVLNKDKERKKDILKKYQK